MQESETDLSKRAARDVMGILERAARIFYTCAAGLLALLSVLLLIIAAVQLVLEPIRGHSLLNQVLESIGLVVIALAVLDVAKFLVEEEAIHNRQLRSVLESRRSLTKFLTIIIIALSLEAIVLVFETQLENISDLIYPTTLMAVAVLAVIGLGLFQRLSAHGGSNKIGDDPKAE